MIMISHIWALKIDIKFFLRLKVYKDGNYWHQIIDWVPTLWLSIAFDLRSGWGSIFFFIFHDFSSRSKSNRVSIRIDQYFPCNIKSKNNTCKGIYLFANAWKTVRGLLSDNAWLLIPSVIKGETCLKVKLLWSRCLSVIISEESLITIAHSIS